MNSSGTPKRSHLVYQRKPSNIPPLFPQCNRPDCTNPVKVSLCTGTNHPEHRGQWYESCRNSARPFDTHFVTWRTDLPPHHVSELVHREVRGVLPVLSPTAKSRMSVNDLVEQTVATRPFMPFPPSPSRMLDRPTQGHSPAKLGTADLNNLFDFSAPQEIELPERVLTEVEALRFAQSVDAAEEERELEASANLGRSMLLDELNRQLSVSNPSGDNDHSPPLPPPNAGHSDDNHNSSINDITSDEPPLPGSMTSDQPRSNGSAPKAVFTWRPGEFENRLSSNGSSRSMCLGRLCTGKANGNGCNKSCSFKMCKPCCALYQREAKTGCKEATHKPHAEASTSSTEMYMHSRPLQPLHYQRREQTQVDHHERSTILQNRLTYADTQNVYVKFWNANGECDMLTVECKTFPQFRLADCSAAVQKTVGATGDDLVRTFDPHAKVWVLQERTRVQTLQREEIVLVRAHDCVDGEGMKEAETREIDRRNPNPRKRKLHLDETENLPVTPSTLSRPRAGPAHPSPTPKPTLHSSAPRDLSASPELPPYATPSSRPNTPTPPPKKARTKTATDIVDLTEPNSRHGSWPWKWYKAMHDGFVAMEKMTNGKHSDVFPSTTNQTKARARNAWNAGTPELKEEFLQNPHSTWKGYVKAVSDLHGGAIPSHTELKAKKNREKGKGKVVSLKIKKEITDIQVPSEIIVIEDSD